tara:strand:- start:13 stop:357 length:345 start_codon:yes stop_codon:yes gene_type:complete
MKKLVLIITLLIAPSFKISADEILSPHTMGHILGGIGSFFLGPLPGIGLSILPELLDSAENNSHNNDSKTPKTTFYVNEYSKEFQIEPYLNDNDEESITKFSNTVKLTNSLQYF